jgi:hypothetical protein
MVRRGDPLLDSLNDDDDDDDDAATMGTEGAADTRDTDGSARFANDTSEPLPLLLALELLEFALLMPEAVAVLGIERAGAVTLAVGTAAAGDGTATLEDGCDRGCILGTDCGPRFDVDAAALMGIVEVTLKTMGGSAQPRSSSMSASRQRPAAAATKTKEYTPSPRSLGERERKERKRKTNSNVIECWHVAIKVPENLQSVN